MRKEKTAVKVRYSLQGEGPATFFGWGPSLETDTGRKGSASSAWVLELKREGIFNVIVFQIL